MCAAELLEQHGRKLTMSPPGKTTAKFALSLALARRAGRRGHVLIVKIIVWRRLLSENQDPAILEVSIAGEDIRIQRGLFAELDVGVGPRALVAQVHNVHGDSDPGPDIDPVERIGDR